jgi:predicted amidohydrolase
MLVKVALVQHKIGDPVGLDLKLRLFRDRPDLVCFPEYWGALAAMKGPEELAPKASAQLATMSRLSRELGCVVIGGTVVVRAASGLHNLAPLFDAGTRMGDYVKCHPTLRERARGIVPGALWPVWDLGFARIAVAICADCLHPETFVRMAQHKVDLLFVPNASPLRQGETPEEKFGRDESIFVAGARRAGAYVVKVCGVGSLFGGRLQGRSLVAAPWGILNRVPPSEEDRPRVVTADLSIDELREFRAHFKAYEPALG